MRSYLYSAACRWGCWSGQGLGRPSLVWTPSTTSRRSGYNRGGRVADTPRCASFHILRGSLARRRVCPSALPYHAIFCRGRHVCRGRRVGRGGGACQSRDCGRRRGHRRGRGPSSGRCGRRWSSYSWVLLRPCRRIVSPLSSLRRPRQLGS